MEKQIHLKMDPKQISFLTALMPTLEGLFLLTVVDGKKGRALLRYHHATQEEIDQFLAYMQQKPGFTIESGVEHESI